MKKALIVGGVAVVLYLGYRYYVKTRTPAGSPGLTQPANNDGLSKGLDVAKSALDLGGKIFGSITGNKSSLTTPTQKKDASGNVSVDTVEDLNLAQSGKLAAMYGGTDPRNTDDSPDADWLKNST